MSYISRSRSGIRQTNSPLHVASQLQKQRWGYMFNRVRSERLICETCWDAGSNFWPLRFVLFFGCFLPTLRYDLTCGLKKWFAGQQVPSLLLSFRLTWNHGNRRKRHADLVSFAIGCGDIVAVQSNILSHLPRNTPPPSTILQSSHKFWNEILEKITWAWIRHCSDLKTYPFAFCSREKNWTLTDQHEKAKMRLFSTQNTYIAFTCSVWAPLQTNEQSFDKNEHDVRRVGGGGDFLSAHVMFHSLFPRELWQQTPDHCEKQEFFRGGNVFWWSSQCRERTIDGKFRWSWHMEEQSVGCSRRE